MVVMVLRRAAAGALVLALALTACTSNREAEPPPSPTPAATEVQVEQPQPFKVKLINVDGENTDNARIFGRAPARDDDDAVQRAATSAVDALTGYLNGMFVERSTRFTAEPVSQLLTPRAFRSLRRDEKAALGINFEDFAGARTGTAEARAIVVHDAGEISTVTVEYAAALRIVTVSGDDEVLKQRGTLLFTAGGGRLRADSLDVELALEPAP